VRVQPAFPARLPCPTRFPTCGRGLLRASKLQTLTPVNSEKLTNAGAPRTSSTRLAICLVWEARELMALCRLVASAFALAHAIMLPAFRCVGEGVMCVQRHASSSVHVCTHAGKFPMPGVGRKGRGRASCATCSACACAAP
jgi:hypothetical protein